MLAYLDADMELCVLDTRAGTELEHASLSTLGVSLSPILPAPPSSQASFYPGTAGGGSGGGSSRDNRDGNSQVTGEVDDVKPVSTVAPLGTYHNAFRACEGRLYLLGRQELRAVRVQRWSQRVESLVQAGEWLEALAVALDHYEQKILPAENAAAAAVEAAAAATATVVAPSDGGGGGVRGGQGVSNGDWDAWRVGGVGGGERGLVGPGLGLRTAAGELHQPQRRPAPRSEAAEHISDLLAQYLRLAINNAPASDSSSLLQGLAATASGGGGAAAGRINLAHSHFQMLAGVCTEFCAVTGRLDMLFGQVFHAFRARGQQG